MREGQQAYTAKVTGFKLGRANTGTDQIGVAFEVTQGEQTGKRVVDYFPLTDAAIEYTFEKLANAGWDGQDLVSFNGLGSVECRIIVETVAAEDAQGNQLRNEKGEVKYRDRVVFVNSLGLSMKNEMDATEINSFAARMRGNLAAFQQKRGIRPGTNQRAASGGNAYQGGARGGFGPRQGAPNAAPNGRVGPNNYETPPEDDAPPYTT